MWRILINSIWAAANTLLSPGQNQPIDQPSRSKWRTIGNFFFSTLANIGFPLARSIAQNETLYECVNALLATPTTTTARNHNDHHERHNSNLSRYSRPNFRRRSHHNGGTVRFIKPIINIHIH
jgi:hypothetical protein